MRAGRSTPYAVGGAVLLAIGLALILLPPHMSTGTGLLLIVASSVPFALAYSRSMKDEQRSPPGPSA